MRIGRRKLLGGAASVLVAALALGAWLVGGTDLLLAIVLATVVAGLGGVGYLIVQAERRARENLKATVDRRLDDLARDLDSKLHLPGEQFEALLRAIKSSHVRLEKELATTVEGSDRLQAQTLNQALRGHRVQVADRQKLFEQKTIRQFRHMPSELDALLQVHRRLRLDDPLPLMGGWALSPRGMLQALELAENPEVSLVVECGSGTSTLFLARVLQLRAAGRLVALEHLPEYAEKTMVALKEHDLDEFAEVRLAPLEEVSVDDTSYLWYSRSAFADLDKIDLVIVDGPPESTGTWARYPAFPLLQGALNESAVILVDDMGRGDERSMVDAWLQMGGILEVPALSPDQAVLRSA